MSASIEVAGVWTRTYRDNEEYLRGWRAGRCDGEAGVAGVLDALRGPAREGYAIGYGIGRLAVTEGW